MTFLFFYSILCTFLNILQTFYIINSVIIYKYINCSIFIFITTTTTTITTTTTTTIMYMCRKEMRHQ